MQSADGLARFTPLVERPGLCKSFLPIYADISVEVLLLLYGL